MDFWTRAVAINIGVIDRITRTIIGASLVFMAMKTTNTWGWIGVYPLVSGVLGTSPLYRALGLQSSPEKRATKRPRPLPPP